HCVMATIATYTPSLHDALPICEFGVDRDRAHVVQVCLRDRGSVDLRGHQSAQHRSHSPTVRRCWMMGASVSSGGSRCPSPAAAQDRKSTRLNSSHVSISYAVFC